MIPRNLLVTTAVLFLLAIGMGAYVLRLRHEEAAAQAQAGEFDKTIPPPAPSAKTQAATLWVAHDDSGTLRAQPVQIAASSDRQERAQELLQALLRIYLARDSPHRLGVGADIHNVYFVDPGLVVINLNSAFANEHTSGVLAETLTITSMIQTLSVNTPGILQAKLLVEGKERETLAGHADLTGFYDVQQVSLLAKQLASP